MPLTPEDLAQLQARHLAFLKARLLSPQAEAEWRANLAALWIDLLSAKVSAIVDAPAALAALDAVLTPEAVAQAVRPLGQRLLPIVLRELAAERTKLGDHVPEGTRAKIEALLGRPSALTDRVLRELAEQEAVQEVVRDVLFDGLKEFSEKVNPFIAEWGIPSLLKRMSVFGGAMTKGLESVRAELDRRSEPEIQRFLHGFTKKGLRRIVDGAVARPADPKSIALRKHMLAWILDQEIAALLKDTDAESIALGHEITLEVAAAELARDDRRAQRQRLLEEALAAAGDKTVGEVLAELGVTLVPDFEALAAATWPLAKAVIGGPTVTRWLSQIVGEFYAEEMKAAGA